MRLEYFQMIDRVTRLDLVARTIEVEARVPDSSTIFEGHFPGYPLMPGVLLIEAMAQTSGWLLVSMLEFKRMAFLAAVKEAKLRQFITPGHTLVIKAQSIHEGSGYAMTEAQIHVGGKLTCNATLTLRHLPFPNDELCAHMVSLAQRIGLNDYGQATGGTVNNG